MACRAHSPSVYPYSNVLDSMQSAGSICQVTGSVLPSLENENKETGIESIYIFCFAFDVWFKLDIFFDRWTHLWEMDVGIVLFMHPISPDCCWLLILC